MTHLSLHTPVGPLTVFTEKDHVVVIEFARAPAGEPDALATETKKQIDAYFKGALQNFDVPLNPQGTDFQKAVWQQMNKTAYSTMITYGDIANALNTAARPVGGACGRNPIPIIIPCHRVVGAAGKLTGYSGGDGLPTKRALLRLEGITGY